MATRMIVTSQPDVPCDVCGRRLLRGEQPGVFLAAGRRRTVCELCAPRASHEGWLRETDQSHSVSLGPSRARRGRNLLDRLRQLRDPVAEPAGEAAFAAAKPKDGPGATYDFFDGGPEAAAPPSPDLQTDLVANPVESAVFGSPATTAAGVGSPPDGVVKSGDLKAQRALEVFNAGEHPRRVAGVARSLGAPSVTVSPLAESGSAVAIIVAWELSWYRYEVDLGDEASGASVIAQGTELSELGAEERLSNAAADADGALSLVESVVR